MKKNSFIEGALIATIGIVLCKIIGLIYVIPFYSLIGSKGGTLYGYAYSIYAIFLNLSSAGIPIAMSKIVSEYNALGYYRTKEKAYKIGASILIALGIISFLIMFIFAPQIASLIIGDMKGGNTVESISLVIRIVSTALLIVPLFSVTKGYLQGHKMMTVPSLSNVIEQLVRVFIIVIGSYIVIKIFKMPVELAVCLSVFAATIGAVIGYLYVKININKNKSSLHKNASLNEEEIKIRNKDIAKKIILYAIPFILIDLINSGYSMVDTFTVVRTMNSLGYTAAITENTYGIVSTWAPKIIMIIISIAIGLSTSLIPNITELFVKKDKKELNRKINLSIEALLFISLPMTIGIYFLARPVWIVFYGYDILGINLLKIFAIQALSYSLYTILVDILQSLNDSKSTLITLFMGFLLKALFNIPLMALCHKLGIGGYYGSVISTIIAQLICIVFVNLILKNKYRISLSSSLINITKIILSSLVMLMSLLILNSFVKIDSISRIGSVLEITLFAFVGVIAYIYASYRSGLTESIFGKKFLRRVLKRDN